MRMKKICLLTVLFLLLYGTTVHADGKEFAFEGERKVTFTADQSDISNYFNGGRASLDLYIRAARPKWLSYAVDAEENRFSVQFSFSFESYEEYEERLRALTGRDPMLHYSPDPVEYMENLETGNLLGFLESQLPEEVMDVYELEELFPDISGELVLNGQSYGYENQLYIHPDQASVELDGLEIYTQVSDRFSYDRQIRIRPGEDVYDDALVIFGERLRGAEHAEYMELENTGTVLEVRFAADNEEELAERTMEILGAADMIHREEAFGDRTSVRCGFTEKINLSVAGLKEEAGFLYEMTLPDSCSDLLTDETSEIMVSDRMVKSEQKERAVSFSFQKPVTFSSVEVRTDLSSPLGLMKRRIQYRFPLSIAPDYHEEIKENLADTLVRGQTLEIYDEEPYRIYEIRYGSWRGDQMEKMGNAQLEKERFQWEKASCPFGESTFSDSWEQHQITFPQVTANVSHLVVLPSFTFQKQMNPGGEELTDHIAKLTEAEEITYRDASPRILLLYGAALLAAVCVCAFVISRIRKAIRPSCCPQCGKKNPAAAKFCGGCGKKLR